MGLHPHRTEHDEGAANRTFHRVEHSAEARLASLDQPSLVVLTTAQSGQFDLVQTRPYTI